VEVHESQWQWRSGVLVEGRAQFTTSEMLQVTLLTNRSAALGHAWSKSSSKHSGRFASAWASLRARPLRVANDMMRRGRRADHGDLPDPRGSAVPCCAKRCGARARPLSKLLSSC
jgi:hypothetical protein